MGLIILGPTTFDGYRWDFLLGVFHQGTEAKICHYEAVCEQRGQRLVGRIIGDGHREGGARA